MHISRIALFLTICCSAAPLRAQEPATEAGALAAAVRFVRNMPRADTLMPILTDTAAVRQALTRCTEVAGAPPRCELVDGRLVGMVMVELRSPTLALVEFREYQVMRKRCPAWREDPEFPEPKVGSTKMMTFTMIHADGRWTWDKQGRGWVC